MTTRLLCLATIFTLLAPGVAAGQRLASQVIPAPTVATAPANVGVAASDILGRGDKDHRYTGFFIGLAVGVGIGAFAYAECAGNSDCERRAGAVTLASASLCAAVGALVGAVIRK